MVAYRKNYASLGALIEDALKDAPGMAYRGSRGYMEGFHSLPTFEAAAEVAYFWQDGVNRMSKIRADIAMGKRWKKSLYRRPNNPGALMIGDYLAGHPEPYVAMRKRPVNSERKGKSRVIQVFVNLACAGGISTEILESRGAAVLALVDAIECSGLSAEVTVGSMSSKNRNTYDYRIMVKRAGDPLNVNSVAFAIGNPDTFRRFIFGAREAEFNLQSATPESWKDIPDGAIHIDSAKWGQAQWDNPESARAWVISTLKDQGVNVELA